MSKKLPVQIGLILKKRRQTLAIAESCTGGLLSSWVTEVPGSSAYFLGGVIAYNNTVKISLLGVPPGILKKHGAVSALCAQSMAKGIQKILKADFALSVTGIAGPMGGTKLKPVGTVYISLAGKNKVSAKKFLFIGTRNAVRTLAARNALALLKKELLSIPSS